MITLRIGSSTNDTEHQTIWAQNSRIIHVIYKLALVRVPTHPFNFFVYKTVQESKIYVQNV